MNLHPLRDNPEAPLWVNIGSTNHHKQITYPGIQKLLNTLFKKAGIKKRSNPHLFRHSRATFMANHLTEFQMNQYFGWIQGSDMPSTYVHMSGREVDNAILTMNGIPIDKKKNEIIMQPKICTRCDTINSFDSKQCNKCGCILDLKTALELEEKHEKVNDERSRADEILNLLLNDNDVRKVIAEKMKLMGDHLDI